MEHGVCPICEKPCETGRLDRMQNRDVNCPRCGPFTCSEDFARMLPSKTAAERAKLSSAFRNMSSVETPKLTSDTFQAYCKQAPHYSPAEKLDRLLTHMSKQLDRLDATSRFNFAVDYPLLGVEDEGEALYLLEELRQRGFVIGSAPGYAFEAGLTLKGWERLTELQGSGRESRFAFVAMWFDPATSPLYLQGILPAIRDAGYEPIKVDELKSVKSIDDEIIAGIRRSRFMVADFTGQRNGVYFESGMMRGLGRNVFWMCRKDELEAGALHFDVRQLSFIAWTADNLAETKKRLQDKIVANEGLGPTPSKELAIG